MNTKTQEALKIAIEAMENCYAICDAMHHSKKDRHEYDEKCPVIVRWDNALNACKEALESQEQEPYGWELFFNNGKHDGFTTNKGEAAEYGENKLSLYTHPAPTWQGLTDNDISKVIGNMREDNHGNLFNDFDFAYAIEQALKEKNSV